MARFAEIDNSNIVLRVVVLDDKDTQDVDGNEVESVGAKYLSDGFGGTWKRTSYNTHGGVHYDSDHEPDGGTALRKNFAGIGYTYDWDRDAFIPPKPYPSWTLNEGTCLWEPPVAEPDEGIINEWNERTRAWARIV